MVVGYEVSLWIGQLTGDSDHLKCFLLFVVFDLNFRWGSPFLI
jgi:hypothetical protein